jgi:hypothetical protein
MPVGGVCAGAWASPAATAAIPNPMVSKSLDVISPSAARIVARLRETPERAGFWLLAGTCWLLASGFRLPASGFRLLTSDFCLLSSVFCLLASVS